MAYSGVQGEGDEQEGEKVSQSHAEQEDVKAVLPQRVVFDKQGEDQQIGTEPNSKDHSTGTGKYQPICVENSHVITEVTSP